MTQTLQRRLACFALSFAVLLACASAAGAQEETKKGIDIWWGAIKGANQWKAEELARVAKDLHEQDAQWQQFLLMTQAVVREGENEYRKATQNLERAIEQHEASPADRRDPAKTIVYSRNLLELGRLYALMCEYDKAHPMALKGWEAQKAILGSTRVGRPALMRGSLMVATILNEIERPHEAAIYVDECARMLAELPARFTAPGENPLLARCKGVEAAIANRIGKHHAARKAAMQALEILDKTGHPLDPERAAALVSLATALIHLDEGPNADPLLREARVILEDAYPKGHPRLAALHSTFARVHHVRGQEAEALGSVDTAIMEFKRLFPTSNYPRGHPGLILAKISLGEWLSQMGRKKEALALHRQAWHESECFYPAPHENQLAALISYGRSLHAAGCADDALARFAEAEQLAGKLGADAPRGAMAVCLLHRGGIEAQRGLFPQARKTLEQALAICRETAPQGHPQLAAVSQALGAVYLKQDRPALARSAFAQALLSDEEALTRFANKAAEAEALAFTRPRQRSFDAFLAAGRHADQAANTGYDLVWKAKASVTRMLQERRAATRIALQSSGEARRLWTELVDARTQISALIASPRETPAIRDRLLVELANKKERLERELTRTLPEFHSAEGKDRGGAALAGNLPRGAAFVDLVRYEDWLHNDQPRACYTAFVVLPGAEPARIDLGLAQPIDAAVNAWRAAGLGWARAPSPAAQHSWQAAGAREAAALRRLVWTPIAERFASGTRLVYLAPDGDLARFPFVVLPGKTPDRILLEDYLIAYVPHGPFLLEHLLQRGRQDAAAGPFLVVGPVNYGACVEGSALRFAPLEESGAEIEAVVRGAGPGEVVTLTGTQATPQAVRDALQSAAEAHLATHGFFLEKELAAAHQRLAQQLRAWPYASDAAAAPAGPGRRLPLAYTGLALAGANQPSSTASGGGILGGETIAELRLEKLRLAVLSACETGLGEATEGEGVQGLVRAFHLAGCPSVIASLWRVDDAATRILMAEFYRQLRAEKKTPLEALRLAQLAVCRQTHPHFWAAFVYSGSGWPLSENLDDPGSWVREASLPTVDVEPTPPVCAGLPALASWSGALLALVVAVLLARRWRRLRVACVACEHPVISPQDDRKGVS